MLSGAVRLLDGLRKVVGDLANFVTSTMERFEAPALRDLFTMLQHDLDTEYLAEMDRHLAFLHLRNGELFSAKLGPGNEGEDLILRYFLPERWAWLKDLLNGAPPHYQFSLHPRDESGARALSDLSDAALSAVATTTSEAADHINAFFEMLRIELAFYIACLNLHHTLRKRAVPLSFPEIAQKTNFLAFEDLRDVSLSLSIEGEVVGNELKAGTAPILVVTGANQGGKSTYLRSIGLAQTMMQAGMFVTAQQFSADLRDSLFTHYRRREDRGLKSGKFDEELRRMNGLVEHIGHTPLFLFNESFAATNEHEGAEISRQIITALTESGARVVFVTHMHALAELLAEQDASMIRFLRAERSDDGKRSFRILPGEALSTSFGRDLYRQIFGGGNDALRSQGDKK
jgi:DNA mismatch repair ATPase MutS